MKFIKLFLIMPFLFIILCFAGNEDFSHKDLSFEHFTNRRLCRCNFHCTDLYSAHFINTTLEEVKFIESKMRFADLHDAKFDKITFKKAKLMDSKIYETDLNDSDFTEADLSKADLHGSDISKCDLTGANLSDANLKGTIFFVEEDGEIRGAKVEGTNFIGAKGLTPETIVYLLLNGAIVREKKICEQNYYVDPSSYQVGCCEFLYELSTELIGKLFNKCYHVCSRKSDCKSD